MKVKYATMIVEDMAESVGFYKEVMGFEIDSQYNLGPAGSITLMKGEGDAMLELIQNPMDEIGLFSVGMDVKNLESTVKKLKVKGVKVTMEPTQITVGSLAFIEDPNGIRIALIQHE
jgi:lactoylglutathione lyase